MTVEFTLSHGEHDPLKIGTRVYLRVAGEKRAGMITGFLVEPTGTMVRVSWPDNGVRWHYPVELSTAWVPTFAEDG